MVWKLFADGTKLCGPFRMHNDARDSGFELIVNMISRMAK